MGIVQSFYYCFINSCNNLYVIISTCQVYIQYEAHACREKDLIVWLHNNLIELLDITVQCHPYHKMFDADEDLYGLKHLNVS